MKPPCPSSYLIHLHLCFFFSSCFPTFGQSTMSSASSLSSPNKGSGPFFRSVPFQILVACGVSFTAPGMWDALGGLGAGGAAKPYAVSAANALVYGLFAIVCVAAGAINNRIGLKYGLALGAIGYPLYGAGLYTNNVSANTWFMLWLPDRRP